MLLNNFKYIAWAWAILISLGVVALILDYEMDIYALINMAYAWLVVWFISNLKD